MGIVPTDRLEGDADARALRRDARTTIRALQALLESPAFTHNVDLAVLTKIAADESMRPRERRRAAEVLCAMRLRTLTTLADLLGVREQSLASVGLGEAGRGQSVPAIQVNISVPKPAAARPRPPVPSALGADAPCSEVPILPDVSPVAASGPPTPGLGAPSP